MNYFEWFLNSLTGENDLSDDFINLLNHYNLSEYDGQVIKQSTFYGLSFPRNMSKCIIYEIFTINEFKKAFINQWKIKNPNKTFNSDVLDQYKITDEFIKRKDEISKINSILVEYMGQDNCSDAYLKDLCRYNLLGGYFEITLKFFLTSLKDYENVSDVREYVLSYLKEISRESEVDYSYPQTINELIQYLIINSNQIFIDFIYNFNGEFLSSNKDIRPWYYLISNLCMIKPNSKLIFDCFNSKYNIYSYKLFIDLSLCAKIILNELKEFIEKNYADIKKLNLKNKFVESEFGCFIIDEIDDFSINELNNIFNDEFRDILDYYSLIDHELTFKQDVYAFCFFNKDYGSETYRKWQIAYKIYLNFDYKFILKNVSLERLQKYLNLYELNDLSKTSQIKHEIKEVLKYDIFSDLFFNELEKRDLIEYFECMDIYDYAVFLNSCEKIIEFIDDFENNYDFSMPQSINEAIDYLIKNSSKEFIDYLYNIPQRDVSMFHFSLGMIIRNEFGIIDYSNIRLIDEINESKYGRRAILDDDYSNALLKELWDYVQENYDDIISNTKFKNKYLLLKC